MGIYVDNLSTLIVLISLGISLFATFMVNSSYKKYKKISNNKNLSGFDVAREILDKNGLNDILVLETAGNLTDHYDPKRKVVKLSTDIYNGKSIAAVAVAAHECGHAIQDKENYSFLRMRAAIYPVVNLSSRLGYIAILLGIIFGLADLLWIGVALEVIILLFQLITLPVEFNASNRALSIIKKNNMINNRELDGAKKMLISAAMTYVASVLTTILELLRLIMMARRER